MIDMTFPICTYIYIYVYTYVYMYIYIYCKKTHHHHHHQPEVFQKYPENACRRYPIIKVISAEQKWSLFLGCREASSSLISGSADISVWRCRCPVSIYDFVLVT